MRNLGVAGCALGVLAGELVWCWPGRPRPLGRTAWRGVHLMAPGHGELPFLKKTIDEALKPLGVNVRSCWRSTTASSSSPIPSCVGQRRVTRADARELAAFCRERGIRLIPQFNCLGHQSWARAIRAPC